MSFSTLLLLQLLNLLALQLDLLLLLLNLALRLSGGSLIVLHRIAYGEPAYATERASDSGPSTGDQTRKSHNEPCTQTIGGPSPISM